MADYQIRNMTTGSNLLTLTNVEFSFAFQLAKESAHLLDVDVAIYGEPFGGVGFTEELWRSDQ